MVDSIKQWIIDDLNTYDPQDIKIVIDRLHIKTKDDLVDYILSFITEKRGRMFDSEDVKELITELVGLNIPLRYPFCPESKKFITSVFRKSAPENLNFVCMFKNTINAGANGSVMKYEINKDYPSQLLPLMSDENLQVAIKFPEDPTDVMAWEYKVGTLLNDYSPLTVNTYVKLNGLRPPDGYTKLTDYQVDASGNFSYLRRSVMLQELVLKSSQLERSTLSEMCNGLTQVFMILASLQPIHFTHYDLHMGNILLSPTVTTSAFKPKIYMCYVPQATTDTEGMTREPIVIPMDKRATIIDFGRSYCDGIPPDFIAANKIVLEGYEFFGVRSWEPNKFHDLLMIFGRTLFCNITKSRDPIKQADDFFNFVNNPPTGANQILKLLANLFLIIADNLRITESETYEGMLSASELEVITELTKNPPPNTFYKSFGTPNDNIYEDLLYFLLKYQVPALSKPLINKTNIDSLDEHAVFYIVGPNQNPVQFGPISIELFNYNGYTPEKKLETQKYIEYVYGYLSYDCLNKIDKVIDLTSSLTRTSTFISALKRPVEYAEKTEKNVSVDTLPMTESKIESKVESLLSNDTSIPLTPQIPKKVVYIHTAENGQKTKWSYFDLWSYAKTYGLLTENDDVETLIKIVSNHTDINSDFIVE